MNNTRFRMTWDEYFLNIATAVAGRSTCLRVNFGAVITKDNIIISTGYNGSASGVKSCFEKGSCVREEMNIPSRTQYEMCHAVHAEANAIIRAKHSDLKKSVLYINGKYKDNRINNKPCFMCARLILNAGIDHVKYYDDVGQIICQTRESLTYQVAHLEG
jgi:dCMP deaminase